MNKSLRVVFMGTPDFAVESLRVIQNSEHQVVAVVTAPDRKKGRGRQVIPSPVKQFALENKIQLLQPENLKDNVFVEELKALQAELFVVVAFRMLPEVVWSIPKLGTINLHASLLPQYRGAAPINWAIMNGETLTGATTFIINEEIDTGNILMQREVEILNEDNAGTLHDKLMISGAELLLETINQLSLNSLIPIAQKRYQSFK